MKLAAFLTEAPFSILRTGYKIQRRQANALLRELKGEKLAGHPDAGTLNPFLGILFFEGQADYRTL